MKPPPFDYARPATVDEAVQMLDNSADAKVLAGGQSLVPMLNFRLARPERLIDIGDLADLQGVSVVDDTVRIGALTRHIDLESSNVPGPLGPMLAETAKHIGHAPIRTRGTFGGSVCHADPVAEWCLLVALLDATIHAVSVDGERSIPVADFYQTVFTTALQDSDLVTHVTLPLPPPSRRLGIAEFSRRAGDFAIVAAMVDVRVEDDEIVAARVCLGGVADVPFRSRAAEDALVGRPATSNSFSRAGEAAAREVSPPEDLHGDATYRRDLVRALVPRAMAGQSGDGP